MIFQTATRPTRSPRRCVRSTASGLVIYTLSSPAPPMRSAMAHGSMRNSSARCGAPRWSPTRPTILRAPTAYCRAAPPISYHLQRCSSPTRICRSGCAAAARSIRQSARRSTAAAQAGIRIIRRFSADRLPLVTWTMIIGHLFARMMSKYAQELSPLDLLDLEPQRFYQLSPFLVVRCNNGAHLARTIGISLKTSSGQNLLHVRHRQNLGDFSVELGDTVIRRAARREHRKPRHGGEIRNTGLQQCRNVRHGARADRVGHAQGDKLAVVDHRQD